MGIVKDTCLYIGDDVFLKLPKKLQNTFKYEAKYNSDYLTEQEEHCDSNEIEWFDSCGIFESMNDIEDFFGYDYGECVGGVYKRVWNDMNFKDEDYFEKLAKKEKGNQMRIKYEL